MKKDFVFGLVSMFLVVFSTGLNAQYDDLYFDPDRDDDYYTSANNRYDDNDDQSYQDNQSQRDDDDDDYDYDDDDYDFQYTSRIRRFHRPYYGFDYYDPCYVDMYHYDPYWNPGGVTVLIYDSPWSYNRWNGWNRWNRWNSWNSWGYYDPYWGWNNGWNR